MQYRDINQELSLQPRNGFRPLLIFIEREDSSAGPAANELQKSLQEFWWFDYIEPCVTIFLQKVRFGSVSISEISTSTGSSKELAGLLKKMMK